MKNTYILTSDGELYHYGVRGMKWGVRRYQNADGSLTPAGKKRVQEGTQPFPYKREKRHPSLKQRNAALRRTEKYNYEDVTEYNKRIGNTYEDFKKNPNYQKILKEHHDKNYPGRDYNDVEPYEYWRAHFYDEKATKHISDKWNERFIKEYADATLEDLNIRVTPEAREYAEEWMRKQWSRVI